MYSLPTMDKFVRFATNVWDISPEGKTAGELAAAGLDAMEALDERGAGVLAVDTCRNAEIWRI